MQLALSLGFSAVLAVAQPSAVLDDLEQRALQALNTIHRPENWTAVQGGRNLLKRQFEDAIGAMSLSSGRVINAAVYAPKGTQGRVPGVILLRTHAESTNTAIGLLATQLAQLGVLAVELDARADHETINQFAQGQTAQGLIQQDVRAVLAYLKASTAVDAARIGLVGEGLATTLAAALNPELSAAVVLDGAPDSCLLMPGILRFASSQEILATIAPRPLLLLNAADSPLAYAIDVYRMAGARVLPDHRTESG